MGWPLPQKVLRCRQAEALYDVEMILREEGLSHFVYDEEKDLFRFPDGRFAFSRRYTLTSGSSKSVATRHAPAK